MDGDALFFEGMKFFFVEEEDEDDMVSDRHQEQNDHGSRARRRMSIQLNVGSKRRRLSLVAATAGMENRSTEMMMPYTGSFDTGGGTTCSVSRTSGRRFSLHRSSSGGRTELVMDPVTSHHL